jgi:hypothetical protein
MATYQDSRYNIALPSGAGGSLVHIKTIAASSDSTISFVDGTSDVVLDNTYRTYIFKFINIHAGSDDVLFSVGFRDGSTAYDATKTTTLFQTEHNESDSGTPVFTYATGDDLAQGTGFQVMTRNLGTGNDECASGELWLFNPSSTTYVKHFMFKSNINSNDDSSDASYGAGYCNVTAAIDAVQFKFNSGNIDAGTFKLYGIA